MSELINVDPGDLHLPPSRSQEAEPAKLARQISKYGKSLLGMPPRSNSHVVKMDIFRSTTDVTRATRAAKLRPGETVVAEVIHDLPKLNVARLPKVKERLP